MLDDVSQADAEGAQDAGVGMAEDPRDAELGGNGAGVLRAGGAEGDEDVLAGVVALGERDAADRRGHVGIGDADEALGELHWRAGGVSALRQYGRRRGLSGLTPTARLITRTVRELVGDLAEPPLHGGAVERK